MSPCPGIDVLLDPGSDARVRDHARDCQACGALLALRGVRTSWPTRGPSDASCERFELDIAAMADGDIAPGRLVSLREHAAACPSCDRVATQLGMFHGELASIPLPDLPDAPPAADAPRRLADAQTGSITLPVRPGPLRCRRQRWAWVGVALAAALAAAACVLVGMSLRERVPAPAAEVVVTADTRPPVMPPALPSEQPVTAPAASEPASESPAGSVLAPLPPRPRHAPIPTAPSADPSSMPADYGYLSVQCSPMCDTVVIDGAKSGTSPVVKRRVAVGRHEVTARLGQEEKRRAAVVARDSTTALRIQMEGSGLVDPFAEKGYITVLCNPYCESVALDGKSLGPTPIVRHATSPGTHRLMLVRGAQRKEMSVSVKSGETSSFRISMSDDDIR